MERRPSVEQRIGDWARAYHVVLAELRRDITTYAENTTAQDTLLVVTAAEVAATLAVGTKTISVNSDQGGL